MSSREGNHWSWKIGYNISYNDSDGDSDKSRIPALYHPFGQALTIFSGTIRVLF